MPFIKSKISFETTDLNAAFPPPASAPPLHPKNSPPGAGRSGNGSPKIKPMECIDDNAKDQSMSSHSMPPSPSSGKTRIPTLGSNSSIYIPPRRLSGFSIKRLVSKEKRRFEQDGFSLDLTYVTSRIIAFGYPAESLEALYRNHYKDVFNFFEQRHADRYKIYNLCTERTYDKERFHNRVSEYRFDDHCPPPIQLFLPFCRDVDAWLNAHPENVAAVHCKAGKGRTGVMICAYMLYTGMWKTWYASLQYFAAARSLKGEGVTIPSQRRFISYFGVMCEQEKAVSHDTKAKELALQPEDFNRIWLEELEDQHSSTKDKLLGDYSAPTRHGASHSRSIHAPDSVHLAITSIRIAGIYANRRIDPLIHIACGTGSSTLEYEITAKEAVEQPTTPSAASTGDHMSHRRTYALEINCDRLPVVDEVQVRIRHANNLTSRKKVGHFWFHTSFVKDNSLVLTKDAIDKAVKDIKKGHVKYSSGFGIELSFELMTAEQFARCTSGSNNPATSSSSPGSSSRFRFRLPFQTNHQAKVRSQSEPKPKRNAITQPNHPDDQQHHADAADLHRVSLPDVELNVTDEQTRRPEDATAPLPPSSPMSSTKATVSDR